MTTLADVLRDRQTSNRVTLTTVAWKQGSNPLGGKRHIALNGTTLCGRAYVATDLTELGSEDPKWLVRNATDPIENFCVWCLRALKRGEKGKGARK